MDETPDFVKKKNILIFYPHNISDQKNGIGVRYINFLKYLEKRGFSVDIFTLNHTPASGSDSPISNLSSEFFTYKQRKNFKSIINRIYEKCKKIVFKKKYLRFPDLTDEGMRVKFRQISEEKDYQYILISYINWAGLIDCPFFKNKHTILDLSDFTTHQLYEKSEGKIEIGAVFGEEIRRVDLFDMVLTVSGKEHYLFSQFCEHPRFYSVPIFMSEGKAGSGSQDIDLLIIGSGNPHNVRGVEWFFDHVIKLLPENVKIAVAGKISDFVPENNQVIKFGYQDDLSSLYNRSRIALSPLLSGSGMKVKVVEALSYGLPVVATGFGSAGIDGTEKNGLFISDDPAGFAEAVVKLLTKEELYKRSSASALRFFRENYSSEIVYKQLDSIFLK